MAHFVGTVSVTWLSHDGADRDMQLNSDFTFVDDAGLAWTAEKGAKINGASIPRIFWSSFGDPFIGDYRRASVVHDYYCDVRTRSSDATHRMFYEACLAGGVSQRRAKTMYTAVKTFGPSWRTISGPLTINGVEVFARGEEVTFFRAISDADYARLEKWVQETDPSIEAIDAEIERLSREMPVLPPIDDRPANAVM